MYKHYLLAKFLTLCLLPLSAIAASDAEILLTTTGPLPNVPAGLSPLQTREYELYQSQLAAINTLSASRTQSPKEFIKTVIPYINYPSSVFFSDTKSFYPPPSQKEVYNMWPVFALLATVPDLDADLKILANQTNAPLAHRVGALAAMRFRNPDLFASVYSEVRPDLASQSPQAIEYLTRLSDKRAYFWGQPKFTPGK